MYIIYYTIYTCLYIGITYFKTIGVVKNIIPAVASTNAIISASCVYNILYTILLFLYILYTCLYIGITYFKTIGVVKNIIPAVASTNAIISASCVLECIKLLTYCNQTMNTYYMYIGNYSIYTPTFEYIKKETCLVCNIQSNTIHTITLPYNTTLQEFIDLLQTNNNYQLKKPSLTTNNKSLYIQNPVNLEVILRPNLKLKLCTLLGVCDPSMPTITTTGTTYNITVTTYTTNNNNNT